MIKVEQLFGASVKFEASVSNADVSIYAVKAQPSGKFLFDAVVNNHTGEIKASFPNGTEIEIDAKVKMKAMLLDSGVTSRPSSDSVKSIIYPRLISLLAELYGV